MSAQKPYCLLMNTEFDKFTSPLVEKYFQRSLFYGIFPSMFSADAANHPYWDNPKWYERDRPLFRRYLPILRELSTAGWEPVTEARSGNPNVYVERFGDRYLTIRNASSAAVSTTIALDHDLIVRVTGHKPAAAALSVPVIDDVLTDKPVPLIAASHHGVSEYQIALSLAPGEVRVLRFPVKR